MQLVELVGLSGRMLIHLLALATLMLMAVMARTQQEGVLEDGLWHMLPTPVILNQDTLVLKVKEVQLV